MTSHAQFVPFARIERGGIPESHHLGVAVVADATGKVHARWGDPDVVTFPRSALKPFQAVDLIESGALDACGLGAAELALACASHSGESFHVERVRNWLALLGCDETCLVCGAVLPGRPEAMQAHLRAGLAGSPVFYNCSGKHCGFLTNARHLGLNLAGYDAPDHALQQRYRAVLSRFLRRDADVLPWSRDDCVLPAPALPMREMATALARLIEEAASGGKEAAPSRILAAMAAHPLLLAGTGGLPQILGEKLPGRVVTKTGAEGYLAVFLPAERLGIVLKVADGNARARDSALAAILGQLGLIDAATAARLNASLAPPLRDSRGQPVGSIVCVLPPPAVI
jgi:L-asparaginase II